MSIVHEHTQEGKRFRVKGTRKIAWIQYGHTAYRKLGSSREILYNPEPSIAFRENELADMRRESIHEIVVDDHKGNRYRIALSEYLAKGTPVNFGYGAQLRLPLRLWQIDCQTPQKPNNTDLLPECQLSLFGEVPS